MAATAEEPKLSVKDLAKIIANSSAFKTPRDSTQESTTSDVGQSRPHSYIFPTNAEPRNTPHPITSNQITTGPTPENTAHNEEAEADDEEDYSQDPETLARRIKRQQRRSKYDYEHVSIPQKEPNSTQQEDSVFESGRCITPPIDYQDSESLPPPNYPPPPPPPLPFTSNEYEFDVDTTIQGSLPLETDYDEIDHYDSDNEVSQPNQRHQSNTSQTLHFPPGHHRLARAIGPNSDVFDPPHLQRRGSAGDISIPQKHSRYSSVPSATEVELLQQNISDHGKNTDPTTRRTLFRSRVSQSYDLDAARKGNQEKETEASDDSFYDSEFDDSDVEQVRSEDDNMPTPNIVGGQEDEKDELLEVVKQLYITEKAYVEKLHLLVRVFLLNLSILMKVLPPEHQPLPPEVARKMFSHIQVIYNFHGTKMLPHLDARVRRWNQYKRIGDLMKILAPFLKLYRNYVETFNSTMGLMTEWKKKSPSFATLVHEVERTPECRRLTIEQHMLDIVHRVPKYQALVKDYLEKLPSTSPDHQDVTSALDVITEIVFDLDRAMGKDARMSKLTELQKKLEGFPHLVKSTREFIKEGKINTISPKSGKCFERHIFLFNDVLLLCTPAGMSGKYKVKTSMEINGMQLQAGQNLYIPNTFYVRCKSNAVEFGASNAAHQAEWMQLIQKAIVDHTTLKLSGQNIPRKTDVNEDDLGKRAPTMKHASATSICMLCESRFGKLKRKYHCKACGQVCCSKCMLQKIPLEYDNNKSHKVCDECFVALRRQQMETSGERLLKASDDALMNGYLQIKSDKGSNWMKRWFALRNDGVLYLYGAHEDTAALTSMSVKNSVVNVTSPGDKINRPDVFWIKKGKKVYYFKAESLESITRWISAIQGAVYS